MGTFETDQTEHEMLQTLFKYEKFPDQAQMFLARMSKNFRWPHSMPEHLRRSAFNNITKVGSKSSEELGLEVGLNLLFFYNALDKGEFAGRENDWVTIHNQKIIEYGQKYDYVKMGSILKIMPDAIQIPVDQTKLPRCPPARMVTVRRVNNGDDYKIRVRVKRPNENLIVQIPYDFYDAKRNKLYSCVLDTGAPETILPYYVKETLGDAGWDNYQCQVEDALVGNDFTDQLAYLHEPFSPVKFLDVGDEVRLATFVGTCS
ncbi:hypothetical protein GLOIN_2v1480732 [Rhizophagus clarus]|uniref:Peptidase A2 domain-containing protein n=1 Tax=Rhizophagus clarus TaxID=94130 RepID=A0A8H3LN18_9GLOM|nr:hypothetical protein GLOIN_2v1480732 [Rhizophagus clarus]